MNLLTKLQPLATLTVLAGFALSAVWQPVQAIWPTSLSAGEVPLRLWQRDVESVQASSPMTTPSKTKTANYDVFLPMISQPMSQPAEAGWPMAGANPQRTSWTTEEVRGNLRPAWYRPIEPYIPAKVQIIAANNLVYVSTAKGLYAFDADTGAQNWVYPTEMPLGNSPTIHNGVAYVGGFDNRIHAIDAITGQGLWTYTAGAGFDTNPLVVNGMIYTGNRDGYMYAVYANDSWLRGTLAWKYKTGGPIHFSAAIDSNSQTVYFASNDGYAYALNAVTGQQIWKSTKLPSAGFHSWWVVVKDDAVILSASRPYRYLTGPQVNVSTLYTNGEPGLPSNPPVNGVINAAPEVSYFTAHPSLKSFYVLNRLTGQESSILPARSLGTQSGNRYPAVIGPDGDVLTVNSFSSSTYGQGITRWRVGSTSIRPTNQVGITAHDEPLAFSVGGNLIYFNQCCDRSGGYIDLQSGEVSHYYSYNLDNLIPGYDAMYAGSYESNAVSVFGGWNGVYGVHGDQNAPVPYKGKVYMHRSNAVIAFSPTGGALALSMARTVTKTDQLAPVDVNMLKQRLTQEIQKMLAAGHLRPGFGAEGQFSQQGREEVGDNLTDYWSSPSDTILVLTQALPHLPADVQMSLRTYIQNEFNNYSPANFTHIGWATGAAREAYDLPPEVAADLSNWPKTMWSTYSFQGYTGPDWRWPPQTFYALWKYAQVFGSARAIFDSSKFRLWAPPSDATLAKYPFAHNAYIAGYWGYLELEKLAGYPEEADKRATLNRLLALRASSFNKDNPWGPDAQNYNQSFSVARNFVNLTPELADYLRVNAASKVQTAFDEYATIAPYWFVTRFEATYREGVMHHLYDYNALFAAKAFIFNAPRDELARYLDVPAFARGDLFYIQNLIYTIEAQ